MSIRIACISGYFGIGGMERTFLTLAETLSRGYSFYFINLAADNFQDRFAHCGTCFYSADYNDIITYLQDQKIDIVITCNCDEGSYLGYLAGTHVIERPDGFSMAFDNDKTPVHAIIASTDSVYDAAQSRYPEKYVTLIHNGVDLTLFKPSDQPSSLRLQYNISQNDIVIGYVGRIARTKCLNNLIDVFAPLAKRHGNICLILAGHEFPANCGYRDELVAQSERLGIGDRVIFLPASEHPEQLYALCDIFVLSSGSYRLPDGTYEVEGIPNAVMEAMAMGLPVVSTDSGETNLLVHHEKSGFIVGVTDWEAFSDHLEQLIDNPPLINKMGLCGREIVKQSFSKDAMISAYDRMFQFMMSDSFNSQYSHANDLARKHFLSHPFDLEQRDDITPSIFLIRSGSLQLFDRVFSDLRSRMPKAKCYVLCTAHNKEDMESYSDNIERLFVCESSEGFLIDAMDDVLRDINDLSLDYAVCLYNDLLGKHYDNVRAVMNRIESGNKLIANKLGGFFEYRC